mmetsp:Transcript_118022/g.345647  ORF Transcript_118022/g.345647 Transcript_118022/m.345647 type:complete len:203 (-) Transcript_118022:45-653(-)
MQQRLHPAGARQREEQRGSVRRLRGRRVAGEAQRVETLPRGQQRGLPPHLQRQLRPKSCWYGSHMEGERRHLGPSLIWFWLLLCRASHKGRRVCRGGSRRPRCLHGSPLQGRWRPDECRHGALDRHQHAGIAGVGRALPLRFWRPGVRTEEALPRGYGLRQEPGLPGIHADLPPEVHQGWLSAGGFYIGILVPRLPALEWDV